MGNHHSVYNEVYGSNRITLYNSKLRSQQFQNNNKSSSSAFTDTSLKNNFDVDLFWYLKSRLKMFSLSKHLNSLFLTGQAVVAVEYIIWILVQIMSC